MLKDYLHLRVEFRGRSRRVFSNFFFLISVNEEIFMSLLRHK